MIDGFKQIRDNVNLQYKILYVYLAVISVLEVLAYKFGGLFSVLASRIWFAGGLLSVLVFFLYIAVNVKKDCLNKDYLSVAGIFGIVIFYVFYIGNLNYSDVSYEACLQLAAGVDALKQADWNYTGTAFIGYPCRQYVAGAIPTAIFGKSVFSLHLGYAYPFLIGIVAMFYEVKKCLEDRQVKGALALIPVYSVLGFRFVAEYYMTFEQVITPISFTMIAAALYIRYRRKKETAVLFMLSWCGCYMADAYVPVLASMALLLFFIFADAVFECVFDLKRKSFIKKMDSSFWARIAVIFNVCVFFGSTFLLKREDRISDTRTDLSLTECAYQSWRDFLTDTHAHFLGFFSGIVVLYIVMALCFAFTLYDFVVAAWILLVVLSSNYLAGVATYSGAHIIHRAMIIIPVVLLAIFRIMIEIIRKYKIEIKSATLVIYVVFMVVTGAYSHSQPHQSFVYLTNVRSMKNLMPYACEVIKESGVDSDDEFSIILCTDDILKSNIWDYGAYFWPNAKKISKGSDVMVNEELIEAEGLKKPVFIFAEDNRLSEQYGFETGEKVYHSNRFDEDVVWRSTVIK